MIKKINLDLKGALFIVFVWLLLQMLFGFLVGSLTVLSDDTNDSSGVTTRELILINILSYGIILLWVLFRKSYSFSDLFERNEVDWKNYCISGVVIIGLSIINTELNFILISLFPFFSIFGEITSPLFNDHILLVVLNICILAPAMEEIMFRGIVLRGILNSKSALKSIVITAFLFAFIHLNPLQIFPIFILGLYLSYVYVNSRNIALVICGHSFYNLLVVVGNELWRRSILRIPTQSSISFIHLPIWLILVGILALGSGLFFSHRLVKKESHEIPLPQTT